jgi:thioredoxin 2
VEAATIQVLDDIWSPWCAPCRKVSPALEQLAGEFAGRLNLVKVNADESPELRQRFEVLATPTLLLIVRGEFIDKQLGAAPAGVAGLGDVEARSLPPHDHFALVSDTPR